MSPVAEAAARTRLARRGSREPRDYPIAVHLMWFAAALLVPVLMIVTFMLVGTARMWRDDSLNDARVIVHHLNATIEVELEKAIAVSQTLATALAVDDPGHVRFEAQARDAAKRLGENIVVRDLTGQQVINTAISTGPLPVGNESVLALDRLAVARRAPVISDLRIGTFRRLPVVNVIVPVLEGTEPGGTGVRWLISVSLAPDSLSNILAAGLPEGWIAGIVGQDGRLIARSVDNDRYIGTANPSFLRAATGAQGTWTGISRDGIAVAGVYIRSPRSQWIVSVAVPETVLWAPARKATAWLGGLTAAALLLSVLLGWRLSRRISSPIRDLVGRAVELGSGRRPAGSTSRVEEVNEVTAALGTASIELERRATAAREATKAARTNEERIQLVQETAGIGTVDWDIVADLAICSPRFLEMFSLPAETETGNSVQAADLIARIHPADRDRFERLRKGLWRREGPFQGEFRIVTPEGQERWIHARGRLDLTNRRPVRLLGATLDITAFKKNEQALLASEARFRGIFENAAVGVALIGLDGRYLLVNQRMCEIVGFSREEMLTKTIKDVTDPADFEDNLARGRSILAGEGTTFSTEKRYVRKTGESIWCNLTVSLQFDLAGAPEVFIAIVRDITVRRHAQMELQERLREIEAVYDNAPVGLTVLDRGRRFLRINRALAEMNGLSPEGNLGRHAWDVLPALKETLDPKIEEVLTSGQTAEVEVSGEIPRMSGSTRYWLARVYPIRQQADDVAGIVMEEITERKRSEEHLRFLLRELSHRSKNLLAVIQAMAGQTAKSAETVDAFRRRFVERLMGLAASHDLLVNQNWMGVSVENLVRGQLSAFVEADDPRVWLRGPAVYLKSEAAEALGLALHELATNSLKYGALSDQGGKLEIVWEVYGLPGAPDTGGHGRRFRMDWIEHSVAPVSPPVHKGFGRMVIEHTVEASLGGAVTLTFPPDGLRWRIDAPASCLAQVAQGVDA